MDILTHTLVGLSLARLARPAQRVRGRTAILVAASLLPDIDVVAALADPTFATFERRTATHSIPGAAALSLALAGLFKLRFRETRYSAYVVLAFLGIAGHIALDAITSFGVALFYPFSARMFEFPIVFIVDPIVTALLVAGLALPALRRGDGARRAGAAAALAMFAAYLAGCAVTRFVVEEKWTEAGRGDGNARRPAHVVPEPLAPFRWRVIEPRGSGYAQTLVFPYDASSAALAPVRREVDDPQIAIARRSAVGMRADGFFQAPVWERRGAEVTVYDLRFRYATLGNLWDPFGFRFRVSGDRVSVVRESSAEKLRRSLEVLREIVF